MAKDNLAYDFDRLERQYAASGAVRAKQPPELRVVENRDAAAKSAMRGFMLALALVAVIFCSILYNRMTLTELTTQIEHTEQQLAALQNENRLMKVELESKISLRTVQDIAENELGMAPAESYQIQYIDLGVGDHVMLAKAPQLKLADYIQKAYHSVLEYLGF